MKKTSATWILAALVLAPIACSSSSGDAPKKLQTPEDWMDDLHVNTSCVLSCGEACDEAATPWKCPALDAWSALPHADATCGGFDGKTFPAPQQGRCKATDPAADALAKTNADATPIVLPDGRRVIPAGDEWLLSDLQGGFPAAALQVPATKWLLMAETGYTTHAVRVIDTSVLRAGATTSPVVQTIKYDPPHALNWGIAYVAATNVLFVPSGIPDSKIFAFDFDTTTGALTKSDTKTIALDAGVFPQAVSISADGKTMLVGQAKDSKVLVVSLDAATYGKVTGAIDVGRSDVFAVRFDPNDASGNTAYATLWRGPASLDDVSKMQVVQLDVGGKRAQSITVGKAPEDMAFIDARYMVVATALSDELAIIDRPASRVASTTSLGSIPGHEPTTVAFDAAHKRLYATLASANGIAVFDVDTSATPPTLTAAGTIPTSWWTTSVTVDPSDGALYVTTGRGHGTSGVRPSDNGDMLRGSIAFVPFMDATALAAATATQAATTNVQAMTGYPTVQCDGAPYDFPLPAKIEDGASTKIKRVVFIVRENKTFDALFGDVAGVDGDATKIMSPAHQSSLWQNARKWAGDFSHMDNFYEDAEQSIQGHFWTVFGRTSDLEERRWVVTWGRGEFDKVNAPGVGETEAPLEGSIFSSLKAQGVGVENMGELIGGLGFRDLRWPGGTSDTVIPDTLGGCYIAARARVLCNPAQFTYAWLGNDHTFGMSAGKPNPAMMISVNDEATGMLLDGISHSPAWAETLVVVVEDDPSDGLDHVDAHRTIALFASPWIKRHYVSHGHYGMASIHKIFAHVFGKPYRNQSIADAPLPLDIFTSTPDYSPFEYVPRSYTDGACNPKGTAGANAAAGWDFAEPDDQPGLDQQVREYLRALP